MIMSSLNKGFPKKNCVGPRELVLQLRMFSEPTYFLGSYFSHAFKNFDQFLLFWTNEQLGKMEFGLKYNCKRQ